jgi:putative ABC transport system substrate-binding protein
VRRAPFALLLGAFLCFAGATDAQAPKLIKIGALTEGWGPTTTIVGFRAGLQEFGYRENEHFVIGVRFTQGDARELPAAARDLVKHKVDLIVASGGGAAAKAAQSATTEIPVVFMGASDPVEAGLVKSFARPGGNITGIADLEGELVSKRMEILHELVPGLKRVLFVFDAGNSETLSKLDAHRSAARRLGLTIVEKPVRTEDDARRVLMGARKGEVDAIFAPRSLSLNITGLMLELAPARGIPTMFHDPFFVERVGLVSYAANTYELGRQAARLVDRIIKGARPADLPVEQPTKFELVINLKTAKALGITIPQSLLVRADRLIQ